MMTGMKGRCVRLFCRRGIASVCLVALGACLFMGCAARRAAVSAGRMQQPPVAGGTEAETDAACFDEEQLFDFVETMPRFEGEDFMAFYRWVQKQLCYPPEAVERNAEGCVMCTFVIEKDGSLSSVQILDSPDSLLSAEVMRVLSASPRWEPAMQKGKVVRMQFSLPVRFKLPTEP